MFYNTPHTTFDVSAPGYKGGGTRTLDYSSVKQVHSSGDSLILKILRTEVTLEGIGHEDAKGLAQVIEIGRNIPIAKSKEYRKYRETAQKEQDRADRRQARVEKVAAVMDGINRLREQSREKALEERERQKREELAEREREEQEEQKIQANLTAFELEIEQQAILPSESEDVILTKLSKLNRLFTKCLNEPTYAELLSFVMRTSEDNLSMLERSRPGSYLTSKAADQMKRFIKEHKKDSRNRVMTGIFVLLAIVVFFVFCYFIDDIFPKK